MKPVDQTIFNGAKPPEGEQCGNCLAACIASVLELPLADVPNFTNLGPRVWYTSFLAWGKRRGFVPLMFAKLGEFLDGSNVGVYTIAGGPGPRGHDHCVVYRDGEMVHDPHPSRDGLLSVDDHTVFIAIDPHKAFGG